MGLDIWSYDNDKTYCLSKYHYQRNKEKEEHEGLKVPIYFKDDVLYENAKSIYPDNINTTQYLRSSYNMYGYNRMAQIYECVSMHDILQPILICNNDCKPITKDVIYQSLGTAKYNLSRWEFLDEVLSKNGLLFRPVVLEYYNTDKEINDLLSVRSYDLLFNSYIALNSITFDLINTAKANMNKLKYRKYVNKYKRSDEELLSGIIKINGNLIGLYQDNLTYYRQTAEIIVKFVEELLQMEEPVLCYWG